MNSSRSAHGAGVGDASQSSSDDAAASLGSAGDAASSRACGDAAASVENRSCSWCRSPIASTRSHHRFCSQLCRQSAWRVRRQASLDAASDAPKRMAYADPPYPGFAKLLYGKEPTYRGEVNHKKLIASLVDRYDGWALSTGAYALRMLLPLCPVNARVCVWVKPISASPLTRGIHNTWEPLIVVPGRERRPGKRDFLIAQPARGGGTLPGRKPLKFCAWLFGLLGLEAGDTFEDLFPGTGVVSKSFEEISKLHRAETPSISAGRVAGRSG